MRLALCPVPELGVCLLALHVPKNGQTNFFFKENGSHTHTVFTVELELGNLTCKLRVCILVPVLRSRAHLALAVFKMMMSFICSCRNKIGAELHVYLEEGAYHKRLFTGPSINDMKK
jgi:hypothetical protein